MQRCRHLEQRGLVHAGKVQAAQETGQRIADREGDDDGAAAHPHHRDTVENDDDRQYHARHQQVFAIGKGAIGHGTKATAHADQADLDQRQTDHQHHDASHQRGDQAFDEGQDARDAHLDERACDYHTKNGRHYALNRRTLLDHQRTAGNQRADEVEAGALNDQQPRAKWAEAFALDEGGDTRDHQRHRNDQIGITCRYAQRLADQQARGDDRYDDRQQVLQGCQQADQQPWLVLQTKHQFIGRRRCAWAVFV